jgi:YfiR/HmsC-like
MFILKRILYLILLIIPVFSLKAQVSYNDVKAVFIERFTRFIDWPDEQTIKNADNFIITVIDDADFYNTLTSVYENVKIKNKKVDVRQISDLKDIKGCQLLFIGSSQKKNLDAITKIAGEKDILTLSAGEGFAKQGTHINFFLKNNQVRFEVNEELLKESGFKVSYLLLNVARIVKKEK